MRRVIDWLVLLAILSALVGLQSCAPLQEFLGNTNTPEGKQAAGALVTNLLSGNWVGAGYNAAEYLLIGSGIFKAVNMNRDGKRKKRGETVSTKKPTTTHPV